MATANDKPLRLLCMYPLVYRRCTVENLRICKGACIRVVLLREIRDSALSAPQSNTFISPERMPAYLLARAYDKRRLRVASALLHAAISGPM